MNISAESVVEPNLVGLRPLLVDAKGAARLLGIGRTTLYELMNVGAITPVRIGRCVRFPVAELERFVASGCTGATETTPQPASRAARPRARAPRRATPLATAPRLFDPHS